LLHHARFWALSEDRFAQMDTSGRLARLLALLNASGLDALVVSSLPNIRYLCGFGGSAGVLAVGERSALVVDSRYEEQAAEELASWGTDVELVVENGRRQMDALAGALGGARRVGVEARRASLEFVDSLRRMLGDREVVPSASLVEELRVVKDPGELDRIEAASVAAARAFGEVAALIAEGISEAELAGVLEAAMRRAGAEDRAFETIVAAGPNAARPHHRPTSRRIEAGEMVVVDFGARVDGYCCDVTRTVAVDEPRPDELRMAMAVARAQRAGIEALRGGIAGSEVDEATRLALAREGLESFFVHGTGHGVGLEVHEAPAISSSSSDVLLAQATVTVEPGVYLRGRLGVRIEDTLVVQDEGCRNLTAPVTASGRCWEARLSD